MIREIRTISESSLLPEPRGFGSLATDRGCLPLCSMDIRASISGMWARVRVCQVFQNSLAEPIEATYVFPLPDRSAVRSCDMHIAGRHIEGILKERGEARRDYDQAVAQGHRAAIAEEDRSEVFSLRVGNIAAGEQLRVELELVLPLDVVSGEATFRFPLVVAPRYVPGVSLDGLAVGQGTATDTDQVPDASRITPPVLLKGFPNPVALSLEVELDPAGLEPSPGAWRDGLSCSLHSVVNEEGPPWRVMLKPGERLDRDFLLRFPVLGEAIGSTLQVTEATEAEPGLLAITLIPGEVPAAERVQPRDVVILLDRSGSMGGWKMVAARRAAGRLVDSLREEDRFAVLAFDSVTETAPGFREELLPATDRNRWGVVEWLGRLEARGGTEMEPALAQAVHWLSVGEESTRDAIVVLVTDGQVAGEDVLLRTLQTSAAGKMPRIFAVGIDQAVNAGFLQRLAQLGRGECELVESEDRLDEVMDRFHRLVGTPRLIDVALETQGLSWDPQSLVPSRLPDLFEGRPLTILARHSQRDADICLRVTGRDASGASWSQELESISGDPETLKSAWGRSRVRELEDRFASGAVEDYEHAEQEIVTVSLECGVLSRFTSFVAIDHAEVVEGGGRPHQIIQPVELPHGWDEDYGMVSYDQVESCCFQRSPAPPSFLASRRDFCAADLGDVKIFDVESELSSKLRVAIEDLLLELPDFPAERGAVVTWLRSWLKRLKALARQLRRAGHYEAERVGQFRSDTADFLKSIRRPSRRAPFSSMEEWADTAREILEEVHGSWEASPRAEAFWK